MSATPADDAQTSPAWTCDCKYTTFFGYGQEKSQKLLKLCDLGCKNRSLLPAPS